MATYRIERKVSFLETGFIDADSVEDLKEKLKTAELYWDVNFDFDPQIECITVYDEDTGDEVDGEFPADIMEEDYVSAMNGAIIFNMEEFERYR